MNCQQCGHPILPDDKFCLNCGAKIIVTDTTEDSVPEVVEEPTPVAEVPLENDAADSKSSTDYLKEASALSGAPAPIGSSSDQDMATPSTNADEVSRYKRKAPLFFRLAARLADYSVYFAITLVIGAKVAERIGHHIIFFILLFFNLFLVLFFFFEALIQKIFGYTLGKYLFSIQVTSLDGEKLSFGQYLRREMQVWAQGGWFGLLIPLPILVAVLIARKYGKVPTWDFKSTEWEVRYSKMSIIKLIPGFVLAFPLLIQIFFDL